MLGQALLGLHYDQFAFGFGGTLLAAGVERFVPTFQGGVFQHFGVAGDDFIDGAHPIGVIGHHKPVIGPIDFRGHAGVGLHLLTQGKTVGVLRLGDSTIQSGIRRPAGVNVCVAKKRPGGIGFCAWGFIGHAGLRTRNRLVRCCSWVFSGRLLAGVAGDEQ